MSRPPSLLARSLEPLVSSLWLLFIVWTVIVAGLWLSGDTWIANLPNPGLRAALTAIAHAADTVWLLLATLNVYLVFAQENGLAHARLLAGTIVAAAAAVGACSVWTGYPLGSIYFTTRLGPKLGPVPLGWPLLWFVVIVGGRALAAKLRPRASHGELAMLTAVGALLTDCNLERIATKVRFFWFWYVRGTHLPAAPPWQAYATWFVLGAALAWICREKTVATKPSSHRPATTFLLLNILLIPAHFRLGFTE